MKRFISENGGMSLIEITFAMGILATALSLLFGALINITVIGRLNEDKAIATTELSTILEEMRGASLAEIVTYTPEVPAHPGVEQVVVLECFDADATALTLPLPLTLDDNGNPVGPLPDLPNPLEVKATLLWTNESGHVFQASTTTSLGR